MTALRSRPPIGQTRLLQLLHWLWPLVLVACATTPDPDYSTGGLQGLESLHRSLPDSAGGKQLSDSAASALGLKARLDEALDRPTDAVRRWLIAGRSPAVRPWALTRLAGLLDLVDIEDLTTSTAPSRSGAPDALATLLSWLPDSAPLVADLAYRLGNADALALAAIDLRYRVSRRLLPWPGPMDSAPGLVGDAMIAALPSPDSAPRPASAWRTASDGRLCSRDDGPGLYAFELDLPPGRHRFSLTTEAEVHAFVTPSETPTASMAPPQSRPRRVLEYRALSRFLPTTFELDFDLRPGERLELHVAERTSPATIRLVPTSLPSLVPVIHPTLPPAALLAATDLAIDRGDVTQLADLESEITRRLDSTSPSGRDRALHPLWLVVLSDLVTADRSRPNEGARPLAQTLLARALGLAPRLPEAVIAQARLMLDDNPGDALELTTALLAGAPDAKGLTTARVLQIRALAMSGEQSDAHALATALHRTLPRSCRIHDLWLETGWEDLRFRPEALSDARFTRVADLTPVPGPCLDARLRHIELARETFSLDLADRLVAPLLPSTNPGQTVETTNKSTTPHPLSPGPHRARAHTTRSRLALARGHWKVAADHAHLARQNGENAAVADELAERAERLASGSHMPTAPAAFPLADARPILARLSLKRRRMPDATAQTDPGFGGGTTTLYREQRVDVHPDGSLTVRVHMLVRPLDKKAVETVGELPIPDDAEVHLARTWKLGGRSPIPLEPEDILEKTTISLPALAVGDVAEWAFSHTITPDPRIAPDWALPPVVLDSEDGPVEHARFLLTIAPGSAPPTFALTPPSSTRLGPPSRPTTSAAPTSAASTSSPPAPPPPAWLFETRAIPQVFLEPFDPNPLASRLAIHVHSPLTTDRLRAAQQADLIQATRPSPAVTSLVDEALESLGEATAKDQLRALYDHIRRQVEEPTEADVLGPASTNASFIAHRRRGARALLLLSGCQVLGLQCELALARPLFEGEAPPHFDLQSHAYPLVVHPQSGTWLDPSGRFTLWDEVPPALHGVSAVVLPLDPTHAASARTTTTPRLTVDRLGKRKARIDIVLSSAEAFTASGSESLDGAFAASWRTVLAPLSPENRERILSSVVQQALPGSTLTDLTLDELDTDKPLTWRWSATGTTQAAGGKSKSLGIALFPESLARATVALSQRETPLLVNLAVSLELSVRVTAPPGFGFPSVPRDIALEYGPMRLSRRSGFEEGGRIATLEKTFILFPAILPPAEYTQWSDAAQAVDRADLVQLVFAPGGPGPTPRPIGDPTAAAPSRPHSSPPAEPR